MPVILSTNHHSVINTENIQEICYSLFKETDIVAFGWGRIFDDGRICTLASNSDKLLDYFNSDDLIIPPIPANRIRKKFTYLLTVQNSPPALLKTMEYLRNVLKIDYPLFNVERYDHYLEIYAFCTFPYNEDIVNFYLNHQWQINKFKQFFNQKAKHLIKESLEHSLLLPSIKLPRINWIDTENVFISIDKNPRLFFFEGKEIIFTEKEIECLRNLSLGHSMKSTGRIMNISPRTVEYHLNNIKEKTEITTKQELLVLWNSIYRD